MGINLVKAAYAFAAKNGLNDQPLRLLVYMATVALDTDAIPEYFAGRDASAFALGLDVDATATATKVKRATAKLVESGAITPVRPGRRGANAIYQLNLAGGLSQTPNTPDSGSVTDPQTAELGGLSQTPNPELGGLSVIDRGSVTDRLGVSHRPLQEEEELQEEERARANDRDAPFDLDTPPTPTPPDSPFCIHHPGGTTGPCWACKQAREAYEAIHGKTTRPPRTPKNEPVRLIHRDGREICADGRHKPMPDGTCARCTIRPDDLAAAMRGIA